MSERRRRRRRKRENRVILEKSAFLPAASVRPDRPTDGRTGPVGSRSPDRLGGVEKSIQDGGPGRIRDNPGGDQGEEGQAVW